MQIKHYYIILSIACFGIIFASCDDNAYTIPDGAKELTNDCLKRSLGPNMVGGSIDFAYAMALPFNTGNLVSAKVEASIAGASGTYLENHSYHTGSGGENVGIEIGSPSVTDGIATEVVFTRDTCASTLRYYYIVPEEARGKQVSFKFSASDSNGKQVSYDMGPYNISEMDMKLDMALTNNSYFSISDMAVYNATQAAENPDKIDLVYLFRTMRGVTFRHAFVSPTAENADYLPNLTLPAGVGNSTKFMKVYASADQQLARNEFGVFVDDLDLREINLSNAPDYGINIAQNAGAWLETADGKYRAYIYVNKASETVGGMTISIKRLKIK
ncbi:MAG: DUF4466 family protein [Candidatus Symbiothrix sp.]|jgi:hypothetical protein|nr:DUF4466 family protein [Candidatus Symbiothrix sp.]